MQDRPVDPFAMLRKSHQRLEERLADLAMAADEGGDAARQAAIGLLGFIERSVSRHERDEEDSLFPRLAGAPELVALAERLRSEHREHEAIHADLGRWVETGEGSLGRIATRLLEAYRGHAELEETQLFPAAEGLLDEAAKAAMQAEMDGRRGRGAGGGGGGGRGGDRG